MRSITKTTVTVTALVAVGMLGFSWSGVFADRCERPMTYQVGSIDNRFDISTSTVRDLLKESEMVWEDAAEKELFTYDPDGDLVVNFVFDERQERTNAANEFESELTDIESSHQEIIDTYESASAAYEAALADYNQRQAAYEEDLSAYNDRVEKWNNRGGAPQDIHEEMTAERNRLNNELEELQRQQQELEAAQTRINDLANQGNSLAEKYNQTATTYTERFGESQEFDQATYQNGEINVYQFEQEADLRLALAHEFGHALGIKHVEGSDSIMYYLMGDQPLNDPSLSQEDKAAFSNVCKDV